jgi:hypothetical protein
MHRKFLVGKLEGKIMRRIDLRENGWKIVH